MRRTFIYLQELSYSKGTFFWPFLFCLEDLEKVGMSYSDFSNRPTDIMFKDKYNDLVKEDTHSKHRDILDFEYKPKPISLFSKIKNYIKKLCRN